MEKRLRVLFTNNTLSEPAGTELSLHDAALSLKARGHEVAAFSLQHGTIAQRLLAAGVPVVDDLEQLPWTPHLIHGHHEWETTMAALRWPDVPVVSFCRGPYLWQEAPCRAPNVAVYTAVDEECRRRLVEKEGIPAGKVELVLNGVDLEKFRPRPPLPAKPKSALIFSNYATEDNFVPVVRAACNAEGIALTVIGRNAKNPCAHPEEALVSFDIVFAKGKSALEALAVGCALIVADTAGLGPMVTRESFSALRNLSFGNPTMTEAFRAEAIQQRLRQFDAGEASAVSAHMRQTCGLQHTIDKIESLYSRALADHTSASGETWSKFATEFLRTHTAPYKLGRRVQEAWNESWKLPILAPLDAETANQIVTHFVQNESKRSKLQERCDRLRAELDALKAKKSEEKKARPSLFRRWSKHDGPEK